MTAPKFFKLAATGVAIFLTLGFFFTSFAVPQFTQFLTERVNILSKKETGKEFAVATIPVLSFFPLGVTFQGLRWGDDSDAFSLTAREGFITFDWVSLLQGRTAIHELRLDAPVLRLAQSSSFQTSLVGSNSSPPAQSPHLFSPASDIGFTRASSLIPTALKGALHVSRFICTDGVILYDTRDGSRWHLSNVNLTADNNLGKGTFVLSDCKISHREVSGALQEANLAVRASLYPSQSSIEFPYLQITLTPLLGLYPVDAGPTRFALNGSLNLDSGHFVLAKSRASIPDANLSLQGIGILEPFSFRGALDFESTPIRASKSVSHLSMLREITGFQLTGDVLFTDKMLRIPGVTGILGGVAIETWLSFTTRPCGFEGNLHVSELNLDKFIQNNRALPPTAFPQLPIVSDSSLLPQATAFPDLNLTLQADTFVFAGISANDVLCRISGRAGHYVCSPVLLKLDGGGEISVSGHFFIPEGKWNIAGKGKNVKTEVFTNPLHVDSKVHGLVDISWEFSALGSTRQEIAETLTGKGSFIVHTMDLSAFPCYVKSRHAASKTFYKPFNAISVDFLFRNGLFSATAKLAGGKGTVGNGSGYFNSRQGLLHATVTLHTEHFVVPLVLSGPLNDITCSVYQRKNFLPPKISLKTYSKKIVD